MPTANEEIFGCVVHPPVDVSEELATDALPEPMVRPIHQPDETNILCKLVEALTHPEQYRFVERNGELFLISKDSSNQISPRPSR